MPAPATLADVQAAARRLAGITLRTPLLENARLNAKLGGRLLLKAECLQRTGSFKLRGAYNFLAAMTPADRSKGVVGWSSGNHAQGLAEAARLLGVRATVVMPADAPALKVANTRASGAEIVLYDRLKDSREEIGQDIARKSGATVVPPYDHLWILTGQGTVGLEIVEQAKELGATPLDAVAAPCSGGGLSTGIALAVKGLSPSTSVHAGEPAGFDDLARSLASGTRQKNDRLAGSICDALLAPTPGDVTLALAQQLLGPGLVVTDDEVLDAMEVAFREFKLVLEPSGAVALAAALTGKLPVKGRIVAVVCSGGNVDHATFARALGRRPAA
jgi:threonine dehydratase